MSGECEGGVHSLGPLIHFQAAHLSTTPLRTTLFVFSDSSLYAEDRKDHDAAAHRACHRFFYGLKGRLPAFDAATRTSVDLVVRLMPQAILSRLPRTQRKASDIMHLVSRLHK